MPERMPQCMLSTLLVFGEEVFIALGKTYGNSG
jgi:hypothetical protein